MRAKVLRTLAVAAACAGLAAFMLTVFDLEEPVYLLAFVLVPAGWVAKEFLGHPPAVRYSSLKLLEGAPRTLRQRLSLLPDLTVALAAMLLAAALAGPRRGLEKSRVVTHGVDIVLCLDVSGSMKADDLERGKSRLFVAKEVADEFVGKRSDDRIGLVLFARYAFRQCPLTLDHDALRFLLSRAEIGLVDETRTAIAAAIGTAVNSLKGADAKSKVIILLTDGRNNVESRIDPVGAAEFAGDSKIKIYTIGAGREAEVRGLFGDVMAVEDPIDEKTLKEIADKTEGKYFRARDRDELERIYAEIDSLEKTEIEVMRYYEFKPLFPAFAAPALFMVLAALGLKAGLLGEGP